MKLKFLFAILLIPLFAVSQEWEERYEHSLSKSKINEKPILLVFAGSDWCAPCIKLDRLLFQSTEFKEYAEENLVLYKADFPRKKKNRLPVAIESRNKNLAEKFNSKGYFPLVLLLDKDETIIGSFAYDYQEPVQYIRFLNSLQK